MKHVGCYDCGVSYGGPRFPDLLIPRDVWLKISPTGDEGGLLCPACINDRLTRIGERHVFGRFVSGPMANRPDPSAAIDLITEAICIAADIPQSEIHYKLCTALDHLAIKDSTTADLLAALEAENHRLREVLERANVDLYERYGLNDYFTDALAPGGDK